jgi:DNA replicative helicase MCM subunit Mcm2 (Cdc46/Mcm family)
LTYKLTFYGCFVRSAKEKSSLTALHDHFETGSLEEIEKQFKPHELDEIKSMLADRMLYHKLISSIAPHIFGII